MLNLKASSYSKLPSLAAYCSSKVIKYFFNWFSLLLLNYILSISLLSFFIYIYIHTHTHTHTHIYISLFCLGQTTLLLPSLQSFFFGKAIQVSTATEEINHHKSNCTIQASSSLSSFDVRCL